MPANTGQSILQKADELNSKAWKLRVSDSTVLYENKRRRRVRVYNSIIVNITVFL